MRSFEFGAGLLENLLQNSQQQKEITQKPFTPPLCCTGNIGRPGGGEGALVSHSSWRTKPQFGAAKGTTHPTRAVILIF